MQKSSGFNMKLVQWVNRILILHLVVYTITQFWIGYIVNSASTPIYFMMPLFYATFLFLLIIRSNARKMIQIISGFGVAYIMMPLGGLAIMVEFGVAIDQSTWFLLLWGIAAGLVSLLLFGKYAFAPKLKKF